MELISEFEDNSSVIDLMMKSFDDSYKRFSDFTIAAFIKFEYQRINPDESEEKYLDLIKKFIEAQILPVGFENTINQSILNQIQDVINKLIPLDGKYIDQENNTAETVNNMKKTFFQSRYRSAFKFIGDLGRGAFGTVNKVRKINVNNDYAIKEMRNIKDAKCVLREIDIFSNLYHPNIVRYYDAWLELESTELYENQADINRSELSCLSLREDDQNQNDRRGIDSSSLSLREDGQNEKRGLNDNLTMSLENCVCYIQMELCQTNLYEWMIKEENFDESQRYKILKQITKGLVYLHSENLIHRDLKPANILLNIKNKDVIAKISDFGLTTLCREQFKENTGNSKKLSNVGTHTYAAKEQVESTDYTQKVDIYSLGIISYELFNKFNESERIRFYKNHHNDKAFDLKYPILGDLISKMMDDDPTKRPSAYDILKSKLFEKSCLECKNLCIKNSQLSKDKDDLMEKYNKLLENYTKYKII